MNFDTLIYKLQMINISKNGKITIGWVRLLPPKNKISFNLLTQSVYYFSYGFCTINYLYVSGLWPHHPI